MVIREGAADAAALLGLVRLANFLARPEQLGTEQPCQLLVDSGTGVTATGEVLTSASGRRLIDAMAPLDTGSLTSVCCCS